MRGLPGLTSDVRRKMFGEVGSVPIFTAEDTEKRGVKEYDVFFFCVSISKNRLVR
jgi:hypothetical protein